jgi:D-lyxose ketol-isomerase
MVYRSHVRAIQRRARSLFEGFGFPLSDKELDSIAVADFGLSDPEREGAQILTLFATERISAKLILLFPHQVLPEHWHPPVGSDPGKEEILRGYWGRVLYFEDRTGEGLAEADRRFIFDDSEILPGKSQAYTCRHRLDLDPGVQIIAPPGTKHWLKGGPEGGCVLSFSTCVRDILDQFTDPKVIRTTQIVED